MGRSYRKVKNSGEIDCWLEELGFYRKNVAYDETCLFRAIAEQVRSSWRCFFRLLLVCSCIVRKCNTRVLGGSVLSMAGNTRKNLMVCSAQGSTGKSTSLNL